MGCLIKIWQWDCLPVCDPTSWKVISRWPPCSRYSPQVKTGQGEEQVGAPWDLARVYLYIYQRWYGGWSVEKKTSTREDLILHRGLVSDIWCYNHRVSFIWPRGKSSSEQGESIHQFKGHKHDNCFFLLKMFLNLQFYLVRLCLSSLLLYWWLDLTLAGPIRIDLLVWKKQHYKALYGQSPSLFWR